MVGLGIDTSTKVGYLALVREDCLLLEETIDAELDHSAKLLPTLQSVLERAGLSRGNLDCIGVGVGPGSLTGVRVGIAFAKGVVLAIRKPLIGVCSLEAIAYRRVSYSGVVSVVVDAKMGGFYHVAYRWIAGAIEQVSPLSIFDRDDLIKNLPARSLVLTPDAEVFPVSVTSRVAPGCTVERTPLFPSAEYIARRAIHEVETGLFDPGKMIEPIYLRPGVLKKAKSP